MNVLVVKMSSMGDVIHTLPAITDAARAVPSIRFDWVVEQSFAEIPSLHPAVENVLPIELRRWRKRPLHYRKELLRFREGLRLKSYDLVIDAQGLIKSAFVARQARGPISGFDRASAREGIASMVYGTTAAVNPSLHAIQRLRLLFARILGYPEPASEVDYGLELPRPAEDDGILLLHGTTWQTKHWPEKFWRQLATMIEADGYRPLLPSGNAAEKARAERIAEGVNAEMLDRCSISTLAARFAGCRGAVCVDTGLGHLAAALDIPVLALFGPTDPGLTGPLGRDVSTLQANDLSCIPCRRRTCRFEETNDEWPPCFSTLTPERVWASLKERLA